MQQTTTGSETREFDRRAFDASIETVNALVTNITSVIRGKHDAVRLALVALFSGGHLLIEDVPGVGKTLLAKALAQSIGGTFGRVQGTPDLLPNDVTGISVFHRSKETWEFRPGPLFANVVVVDEINRATPRTQSALLEAMEERQVTVDDTTRPLPDPFFVVATQNPQEHHGTFPLVEGQRDRFAVVTDIGYPDRHSERELLMGNAGTRVYADLAPAATPEAVARVVQHTRHVHCKPSVADYVLDIVSATRVHPDVALGVSPRGALSLLHCSQAHSLVHGRTYVTPQDVQQMTMPVLSHRLVLRQGLNLHVARNILNAILHDTPVPKE